ncbi:MAG: DNA mismatch repair protein MutS [Pseudomonadota bacterium]
MMAQYLEIKEEYPDALLFYRMGDFYEMFFEDAVSAAEALDIALTKRGKHLNQDIPMCGVPVHAAENYLLSLIRKGFRVGVCEQLEDPAEAKKRGSKSVVKRGVVRLVTPGTLTEDTLLDARRNNFLCAYALVRGESALAWVDVSTGEFHVMPCPAVNLPPALARLAPKELLVTAEPEEWLRTLVDETGAALTELSNASFDSTAAVDRLTGLFGVKSLDGFGQFGRPELSAMGALVDYLDITQKGKLPLVKPPVRETVQHSMRIDAATRRNLELTRTISGDRAGSLISVIDRTVTGPGARLLEARLTNPLAQRDPIIDRLDAVSHFSTNTGFRQHCRETLRRAPDMDRALTRLSLDRGGPRDMAAIRDGLHAAAELSTDVDYDLPSVLADAVNALVSHDKLRTFLEERLVDEPPILSRDGGYVREGYHAELDEARQLRDDGRKVILNLQKEYAADTEITSLKVKHNNVLGYFIETPSTHADKMLSPPLNERFIHRQTTANAVRFTTLELSEMETKILNAGGRALGLELEVFEELRSGIIDHGAAIGAAAKALAEVDLHAALAELSVNSDWVRPVITADKRFEIAEGRHPVVEHALSRDGQQFVANDCDLSDTAKRLWLLTGPNMAGKSTFLRQNALIAVLAQMGSFVPATRAEIGVVSQLFSRVGASDDLARGRSTFMVEMVETAAILNQADENALVILDEIGRGTATYDGLSIAWATLEHLHEVNQCRSIFATHYHELTGLSSKLDNLMNATIAVREWEGDIVFLHEVRQGAADRSYGVQVAQLAGLPPSVVERARVVLDALEKGDRESGAKAETLFEDLPLFSAAPPQPVAVKQASAVEDALAEVHPDQLTPIDALKLIYELKSKLGDV